MAAYERFDATFLAVLRDADGTSLTAERIAARADDPFARPHAADWLEEAFGRGLVNVRRQRGLPAEWKLTRRGKRLAREG